MKSLKTCLVLMAILPCVMNHGNMYFPFPWTSATNRDPAYGLKGLKYYNQFIIPDDSCDASKGERCSESALNQMNGWSSPKDWFTNYTFVQEQTLPDDMFDPLEKVKKRFPWASPGSAPVYGEGCGVNGGNPNGCIGESPTYGTCCGKNCGGYSGGLSALEHAAQGLFDSSPVNVWQRGQVAEVYWNTGGRHRGGYSYRLCQAPNGDISKVTEQCFQDGHLDFVGDKVWVVRDPRSTKDLLEWTEKDAIRTRDGTNPAGSQWTRVPIDIPNEGVGNGFYWAFKDLVQVPEDLNPGIYVLSFRWDCQLTPQVWTTCATIQVE